MTSAAAAPVRPATIPECVLHCNSSVEQLQQLYVGFGLLARRGEIRLRLVRSDNYKYWGKPTLMVVLDRSQRLLYDVWDDADLRPEVRLDNVDVYFKRCCRAWYDVDEGAQRKILPLGLNYEVYSRHDALLRRAWWSRDPGVVARAVLQRSDALARFLPFLSSVRTRDVSRFEGAPRRRVEARVFLVARTWEPGRARTDALREHRDSLNRMRAGCIRRLRRELGPRFVGGLPPNDYNRRHYPDCLITDSTMAFKDGYLRALQSADICVATSGLLGSVAWRLAEYVAAAKAIVSEPLECRLPGEFAAESNYLPFDDPDHCVAAVLALAADGDARVRMMEANASYYREHVRPDALVRQSLAAAIELAS